MQLTGIAMSFLRAVAFFAGLVAAGPALAERELHYVGIYEGNQKTGGVIHGPEARVFVDRPGAEVVLVLADYGPVRWFVETAGATVIEQIILGGIRPERSEVRLNGVPFVADINPDIPYVHQRKGKDFRALVKNLPEQTGLPLSSASVSYAAPEKFFAVTTSDPGNPAFSEDPLATLLAPADRIPEGLLPLIGRTAIPAPASRFTSEGMEILQPDGSRRLYPATLDMPEISWPTGSAIVPEENAAYGVSLGGEGFLYRVDLETGVWSVVMSMENADAKGMLYDPAGKRFVMPEGVFDLQSLLLVGLDGARRGIRLGYADLPGSYDLFDPGNGPDPVAVPVAVDGGWLLLHLGPDGRYDSAGAWRDYAVNVETGEILLIGYSTP